MPNKSIKIGDEDRPVNFGRNFWAEVETLTGKTSLDIFKNFQDLLVSYKNQSIIAYSSLKWGLYDSQKGLEPNPKFTLLQVSDWLESNPDIIYKFWEYLNESLPQAKKKEEVSEEK